MHSQIPVETRPSSESSRIDSIEDAERRRFVGSPTILVDGRDPFAPSYEAAYG